MPIRSLQKPSGRWCVHCKPGSGCTIHATRPDECRSFFCQWMIDPRLGPEWKPERSKFVLTSDRTGNHVQVRCDPGFPQAWRAKPYNSMMRQWAAELRPLHGTITVMVGMNVTLVAPEGEFPLGVMREDDRIHMEFSGTRLARVRLVKNSEAGVDQRA
jgi:hypothetical protein